MKSVYALLICLLALLLIMLLAWIWSPLAQATGVPHPEYKGMYISVANIDEARHTRWLGYFFGLGIIGVFGSFLFLGNRKKGKLTPISQWLWIGIVMYSIAYSGMVFSHWEYVAEGGGAFVLSMPIPTAWMICGVWFVPAIITLVYILKFESWIISEEEIATFHSTIDRSIDAPQDTQ